MHEFNALEQRVNRAISPPPNNAKHFLYRRSIFAVVRHFCFGTKERKHFECLACLHTMRAFISLVRFRYFFLSAFQFRYSMLMRHKSNIFTLSRNDAAAAATAMASLFSREMINSILSCLVLRVAFLPHTAAVNTIININSLSNKKYETIYEFFRFCSFFWLGLHVDEIRLRWKVVQTSISVARHLMNNRFQIIFNGSCTNSRNWSMTSTNVEFSGKKREGGARLSHKRK